MVYFQRINPLVFVINVLLWSNQGKSISMQSTPSQETAPVFTTDLPKQVTFQNTEGLLLPCTSKGRPAPANEWIYSAGSGSQDKAARSRRVVQSIPLILTVFPNNSLWFHPFQESQYLSGVHTSKLRCIAANTLGTVISTEVSIKAVMRSQYIVFNTRVEDVYVMRGATAVFTCKINPPHLTDVIKVLAWQRANSNITNSEKFLQVSPRSLYVYNVSDEDVHYHYTCVTLNTLTGTTKYSDPASIYVLNPITMKPAITGYRVSVVADVGSTVVLPCVASGYPHPVYSYMKDRQDLGLTDRHRLQRGSLAISDVQQADDGRYTCRADNSEGIAEVSTVLTVRDKLAVSISPADVTIDAGEETFLQCNIRGFPVKDVIWYRDGSAITRSDEEPQGADHVLIQNQTVLHILNMQRTEQGVYQCFVGNKWETVQTSALLRLGVARPEISSVLEDRYVSPGENVTINCIVTGNPQPLVYWTLDGENIDQLANVSVMEYTDPSGTVTSTLHLSPVIVPLGGTYTCVANSSVGTATESATLYVYGEPFIKALSDMMVLAHSVLLIDCHVSGYPLKQILWTTDGVELPLSHRQHVWSNGTLQVTDVTKSDAGTYTCVASNVQGQGMNRSLTLTVLDPPTIDAFDFGEKKVGDRVSVSCVVSRGDLPLQFEWLKDGQQIPSDLGVVIQHTGAFSSMLSIPQVSTLHSGNYSCVCRNKASQDQVSDLLQVNVPPRWISEPYDTSVVLGGSDTIPCLSYGIPSPNVSWTHATETPGIYLPVELGEENSTKENLTLYQTQEGSLVVRGAQRSHQGHYLCQAANDVGTALGKLIYLEVNLPPYFETNIINKTVRKGSDIRLDCLARGEFPMELTWSTRENKMNLSNARFIHSEKLYDNGKLMTLQIAETQLQDTGIYVCNARNEYGAANMHINLHVQDVPSCPHSIHVTDVTHSTATVSWTPGHDGNSPLLYYLITYQPIEGINGPISVEVSPNVTQTTLRYLHPALMYHLVITAENTIGRSNESKQVAFKTTETAPTGPPQNVQAFGISEQIIQLVWEPPKLSLQNGKILGYRVLYRRHPNHSEAFSSLTKLSSNRSYEHMNLEALDMFTQYEVKIQAYNAQGDGPFSNLVMEYTKEGVPSASPESVQAAAMSSQDIYVVWSPPRLHTLHGILQGYKVYYSKLVHGQEVGDEKSTHTTEVKTVLRVLDKYSVYSIQVVAYTRVGEGVRSEPVFVQTKQDVPGAPSSIKALPVNATSVIVSWQKPELCNGVLTHYTLYIFSNNQSSPEEEIVIDPLEESYIHQNVSLGARLRFQISASTVVGEGRSTREVEVTVPDKVPARIASFPLDLHPTHHSDVYLPCFAVGSPAPVIHWFPQHPLQQLDAARYTVTQNGSLHLRDVTKHDQGVYKCVASNVYGSDELQHHLIVLEPPLQPVLFLLGRLSSLLEVGWHITSDPSVQITGFVLMYSSDDLSWDVIQLSGKVTNYTIHNLNCGSIYYFKVKAKSNVGDSEFSETKMLQTTGGAPLLPSNHLLLHHVNSTFALLNLSAWQTFGCPVNSFTVEVQVIGQEGWESVHTHIPSNTTLYQIELQPETWYLVRVSASSQPGTTTVSLKLATKSYSGSTIGPIGAGIEELSGTSNQIYYLVIGVTASVLLVIVIIVWIALHCCHRRLFFRGSPVTSGFKRDGTITDMSLLPESDKEMDMSVISSSEDVKPCNTTRSHYSRTPTRVLNVSALVCSQPPVNRHSHISYSGSEDSFQSEKDGKIIPYATFAPSKLPTRSLDESTPLKADESDVKPPYGQSGEYINTQKSSKTDNYYLSPLKTTSVKVPVSTEDERKPLMT